MGGHFEPKQVATFTEIRSRGSLSPARRLVDDSLDALTEGRSSRSQLVRLVLEDFLAQDAAEQQQLIVRGLFGPSKE